ncbi:hypothetical protein DFH28DRAFT_935656 [Melampsora americana]|nr:hypothetical protein DFH28DRAFT_935656 [Melampsora americana]
MSWTPESTIFAFSLAAGSVAMIGSMPVNESVTVIGLRFFCFGLFPPAKGGSNELDALGEKLYNRICLSQYMTLLLPYGTLTKFEINICLLYLPKEDPLPVDAFKEAPPSFLASPSEATGWVVVVLATVIVAGVKAPIAAVTSCITLEDILKLRITCFFN